MVRGRMAGVGVVAVAAVCAVVVFGPAAAGAALPSGVSFGYTDGEQAYLVPTGVASVAVTAVGAAGGVACHDVAASGGLGAVESADLTVYGGELLYVEVGGVGGSGSGCGGSSSPGGGGFNGGGSGGGNGAYDGGGGGGASDVRTISMAAGPYASLGSRTVVAAGGGGDGGSYPGNSGGTGGNADSVAGGGGGGSSGGGGGATVSTFGAGGAGPAPGIAGVFGMGGAGAASSCSGGVGSGAGGGGGGYWGGGGGGGGCSTGAAGGGGGSSFASAAGVSGAVAPTTSSAAASVSIVPLTEATDSLSTGAATFASTVMNTISNAQTVTFSDTGTATLTGVSASITGTDASDFLLTDNTCTGTVAPQSSCAVTMRFAPQAVGGRSASLQFLSDAASSPDVVALAGTGAPASSSTTGPAPGPASGSPGGGSGTAPTLTVPVVGSSAFTYPYVQIGHGSTIAVIANLPGAGDFDVLVTSATVATAASAPLPGKGRQTFAVFHTFTGTAGRVVLELHPTYQGRQLVKRDAHLHKRFRVTVEAIFTPSGGKPNPQSKTFTIRPVW